MRFVQHSVATVSDASDPLILNEARIVLRLQDVKKNKWNNN